jgi:hypothetical protein
LILAAEVVHNHTPLELAVIGVVLAVVGLAAWHLHAAFRATPANFPAPRATPTSNFPTDPAQMGYRKGKRVER